MHCSSIANFFWLSSIIATCFLVLVVLKVAILLFSTININALFLLQLLYKYKGIILGPQFLYCNFFFQNFDMVHNKWSSIIFIWTHRFFSATHSLSRQSCFTKILFTYFLFVKSPQYSLPLSLNPSPLLSLPFFKAQPPLEKNSSSLRIRSLEKLWCHFRFQQYSTFSICKIISSLNQMSLWFSMFVYLE